MTKPTYPRFVQQDDPYIDYEISHELPSFDDPVADSVANEHSIVVRFTYDIENKGAYGRVTYEQNGVHCNLGELRLSNEQFYRITNHPVRSDDKLATLRNVEGNITIKDGVATLPNGAQIVL